MDKGKSVVAELAASFSDVRVAPRQNPKPKSFLPSPSFCKFHALVRLSGGNLTNLYAVNYLSWLSTDVEKNEEESADCVLVMDA